MAWARPRNIFLSLKERTPRDWIEYSGLSMGLPVLRRGTSSADTLEKLSRTKTAYTIWQRLKTINSKSWDESEASGGFLREWPNARRAGPKSNLLMTPMRWRAARQRKDFATGAWRAKDRTRTQTAPSSASLATQQAPGQGCALGCECCAQCLL